MTDYVDQQFGNYHLIRLLGQGGFADVYLGEHIHIGIEAAIKVLNTRLVGDDIEQFRNEARFIARLKHPNIVSLLDFGVENGTPFLVMEYAPNGSLRQRHPKDTRLPLDSVVHYVEQVTSALQYAHDQRVIHRDVKPDNMLLGRNNEVLLSDFGIAVQAQSSRYQETRDKKGTITYMAPEQLQGKPRPASDQYALGITIYEWLCGELPFHGSLAEIYSQQMFAPPPSLREKVPTIPPSVEQVVLRTLAKDPTQRFSSVEAFACALKQASLTPDESHQSEATWSGQDEMSTRPISERPSLVQEEVQQESDEARRSAAIKSEADGSLAARARQRGLSQKRTMMLIGLTLLIILGSVGVFSAVTTNNRRIADASATATTVAVTNAYNKAVAANGIMYGFDAAHSHFNPYERILSPATVPHLKQAWTAQTKGPIPSSPAVANGVVYVGSQDYQLYAFDAVGCGRASCAPLWAAPTNWYINSSPVVANGVVYVGSNDNQLYAFDATGCGQASCAPLWTAPTGSYINSSPAVANGVVYIGSTDGKLYAFKAIGCGQAVCTPLWTAPAGAIDSAPVVANGVVYVGSRDGKLYAFKAIGCGQACVPLWTAPTGAAINSSPAVANGIVYVGSNDGKLYVFKAEGCGQASCVPLWTAPTGAAINYSSPAVANGVVYIGSTDGKLYAFKAEGCGQSSCAPLWTAHTRYSIDASSPTVANGVVYVGSNDHQLYAFDATGCGQSSCVPLWTAPTGAAVNSSPAVANGIVYVGSNDGKLYAFHLPSTSGS